jgi:hypothetical protein
MDMKIRQPELGKPVLKQYTPEEYRLLKEQEAKQVEAENVFKDLRQEFLEASQETIQVFRASDPDFENNLRSLGLSEGEIQKVLKKVHEENSPLGE